MASIESVFGSTQGEPDLFLATRATTLSKHADFVRGDVDQVGRACLVLPQCAWQTTEVYDHVDLAATTRIGLENKGIYGWWRTTSGSPCPGDITYYHPQRNWTDYKQKLSDVTVLERTRHELETLGYNDHAKVASLLREQEKLRGQRCYCDGHQGSLVLDNQVTLSWQQLQRPLLLANSLFRLAAEDCTAPELLAKSASLKRVLHRSRLAWHVFGYTPADAEKLGGCPAPVEAGFLERLLGGIPDSQTGSIYAGKGSYAGRPRDPDRFLPPWRGEGFAPLSLNLRSIRECWRKLCQSLRPLNTDAAGTLVIDDSGLAERTKSSSSRTEPAPETSAREKMARLRAKNVVTKSSPARAPISAKPQTISKRSILLAEEAAIKAEQIALMQPLESDEVLRPDLGTRRFEFNGWRRIAHSDSELTETTSLSADRAETSSSSPASWVDWLRTFYNRVICDSDSIWVPDNFRFDDESALRAQEVDAAMFRTEQKIINRNFGLRQSLVFTLSDFIETIMPHFPESILGADLRRVLRQSSGLEPRPVDETVESELRRSVAYQLNKDRPSGCAISGVLGYNVGRYANVASVQDTLIQVAPTPLSVEPSGCTVLDMLDPLKLQVKRRIDDMERECAQRGGAAVSGFDLLEKRDQNPEEDDDVIQPWWLSDDPGKRQEVRAQRDEVYAEYKNLTRAMRLHRAEQELRHQRPLPMLLENRERTPRHTPCWAAAEYDPQAYQHLDDRVATGDPKGDSLLGQTDRPSHLRTAFGHFCQVEDIRGPRKPVNLLDDRLGGASLRLDLDAKRENRRRFSDLPLIQSSSAASDLSEDPWDLGSLRADPLTAPPVTRLTPAPAPAPAQA